MLTCKNKFYKFKKLDKISFSLIPPEVCEGLVSATSSGIRYQFTGLVIITDYSKRPLLNSSNDFWILAIAYRLRRLLLAQPTRKRSIESTSEQRRGIFFFPTGFFSEDVPEVQLNLDTWRKTQSEHTMWQANNKRSSCDESSALERLYYLLNSKTHFRSVNSSFSRIWVSTHLTYRSTTKNPPSKHFEDRFMRRRIISEDEIILIVHSSLTKNDSRRYLTWCQSAIIGETFHHSRYRKNMKKIKIQLFLCFLFISILCCFAHKVEHKLAT